MATPKESQSTQQFVEIEDIKDGVVMLKSGSIRRILMVSGINFNLKSEEEQNIITYSYQSFLNSLDFSIQIVVHSRKLNIASYLDKLLGRRNEEDNELLKTQMTEYIEFIKSFVETNAVMTKTIFVVVPYDPIIVPTSGKKLLGALGVSSQSKQVAPLQRDMHQDITQLDQRVDQVVNGLTQIGLRVVALNDEELIELFYNLYNPQTIERKEIKIAKE